MQFGILSKMQNGTYQIEIWHVQFACLLKYAIWHEKKLKTRSFYYLTFGSPYKTEVVNTNRTLCQEFATLG